MVSLPGTKGGATPQATHPDAEQSGNAIELRSEFAANGHRCFACFVHHHPNEAQHGG